MAITYVSPTGSPSNPGTYEYPKDFDSMIGVTSPLVGGDEVRMKEGTYTPLTAGLTVDVGTAGVAGKGSYNFYIDGSPGNNIVFMSCPGEWARINGAVQLVGHGYITFMNMEIAPTPTTRTFVNEAAIDFASIYANSPGVNFINCYIHDFHDCYLYQDTVGSTIFHGCILGWCGNYTTGDSQGHGYGIYAHNFAGGNRYIQKNMFTGGMNGYALGMQSAGSTNIRDFYVDHNIFFGGGMLTGSNSGTNCDNNHYNYNYMYSPAYSAGQKLYGSFRPVAYDNVQGDGEGIEALYNYIVGDTSSAWVIGGNSYPRQIDFQHNTVITHTSRTALLQTPTGAVTLVTWDNNTYHTASATPYRLGVTAYNLADWRIATGFDLLSTETSGLPTTNEVFVIDNDYANRGFVAIYNWEGLSSVTVDISSLGLVDGRTYRVRNCLNYSEYSDRVYNASDPLHTFNMLASGLSRRLPTGYDVASQADWVVEPFPTFGAFLIEELVVTTPTGATVGTPGALCMTPDGVEYTEYITPDGITYRFDSHDKFLMSETGWGMPPISYIAQRSPLQHGETLLDFRLNPRVIQLVHRRNGRSRKDYWENRADIIDMLRPNRQNYYGRLMPPLVATGVLRKRLPDGSKRDLDVVIEQGPEFAARDTSVWDEWAFTETLRFIAHDPVAYDPELKSHTFTLAQDNQLVFPFSFPVAFDLTYIDVTENLTNAGTWLTYPTIVLTGPASGFIVENTTTGEKLAYNALVSEKETITIDLRFGRKTVTSTFLGLTTKVNVIGALSADSDIATFHLAPDPEAASGVNAVNIYVAGGNAQTALTVSWYDRYIGL